MSVSEIITDGGHRRYWDAPEKRKLSMKRSMVESVFRQWRAATAWRRTCCTAGDG